MSTQICAHFLFFNIMHIIVSFLEVVPISAAEMFSIRLRQLREENSLSQTELAEKLKVSRGSISYYENQSRLPDISVLSRICDFFSVSSDYLLGRTDDPQQTPTATEETGLSYDAVERLVAWNTRYPDGKTALTTLSRMILFPKFLHLLLDVNLVLDFASSDTSLNLTRKEIPSYIYDELSKAGHYPVPNSVFLRSSISCLRDDFGAIISSFVQRETNLAAQKHLDETGLNARVKSMSMQEIWDDFLKQHAEGQYQETSPDEATSKE